jgi:FKBP-type peptidyl-prolyl cis-trans isomerase SlyD
MKEGDFIKLEFDAFVKETDMLMDTTHEEVAKEHDVYNERATYTPISVIVGSGHVIKGLDDSLKEAKVGEDVEVEIEAKDGYGDRDPKLIEVFPMNKILSLPEFRKGDKYPTEGMELRINNRIGYINRIFAGRVRVDFNNRFAGRTLLYKYKITELIKKKEDKMRALVEAVYPNSEEFEFKNLNELRFPERYETRQIQSRPGLRSKAAERLLDHFIEHRDKPKITLSLNEFFEFEFL